MTLTYVVPILAMGVCYGRIGSVLWGKGILEERVPDDVALQRKLLSKRKVPISSSAPDAVQV